LRALFCVLLPLGCLLAAGTAAAAVVSDTTDPSDQAAPMCDPSGASVAARPEIPEVDRGRLQELPCEAQLWMAEWQLDAPDFEGLKAAFDHSSPNHPLHFQLPRSRYEGACDFSVAFPERAEPVIAALPAGIGLLPSRGYRRLVFRPPSVR
jgi:hypothetical protein